jgi:hypothetical protein
MHFIEIHIVILFTINIYIMKTIVLFLTLSLFAGMRVFAQVGINADNSAIDNSAMLDVKSTTRGFLPPRVALTATNAAAPVASPASGLLVYNTATAGIAPNNVVPGYYYWNGTSWSSLLIPAGTIGQTLFNNGGSWVAGSNLFNNGTNVGIGTTSPSAALEVLGEVKTTGVTTYGFHSDMNTGTGQGYGGYFKHTTSLYNSFGVYGDANYTGSTNPNYTYGGYFKSSSTTQDGYGVYASASNSVAYSNLIKEVGIYGVGHVTGATGRSYGVYGLANGGSNAYGVYGSAGGAATNWAGYFDGNVIVSSGYLALNNNELRLRDGGDANHGLKYNATVDGPYLYGFTGGALGTAGNPNSLWWNSSGDVNVGNNFAVAKSVVVDNAAANDATLNNALKFGPYSGEGIGSNRTTGTNHFGLDFYTAGFNRMSVTNSGDVGIGTVSPGGKLDIQGPQDSHSPVVNSKVNYTGGSFDAIAGNFESSTLPGYGIGISATGGYQGVVGKAHALNPNITFDAYGGYFEATGYGADLRFGVYAAASGSTITNWAVYSEGNSYSTGAWQSSDARLKSDARPIEFALDKIMRLNPSTYNYKTDEYAFMNLPAEKQYGFLAQELEQVFPEMVREIRQPLKDMQGNLTRKTFSFKGVNYDQLIAVVVSALQEEHKALLKLQADEEKQLSAKDEVIEQQSAQVDQLMMRMDLLERRMANGAQPSQQMKNQ